LNINFKKQQQQSTLISNQRNVLLSNVPLNEITIDISKSDSPRKYIQQDKVQKLAEDKECNGLTYKDIMIEFKCSKEQAQRKIKHFHSKGLLFTNQDLNKEAVNGLKLKNTSPQKYYATTIKTKVIEKHKERYENALVKPTMDKYKYRSSFPSSSTKYNDPIQIQRARYLSELLSLLESQPPHIHKLQLLTRLPNNYYEQLEQTPCKGNSGKQIEEHVGSRLVKYIYYPDGSVIIYVISSKNPFRIRSEEDVDYLLTYLGQVRDRMINNHIYDIYERHTPPISEWFLTGCDINKDLELNILEQLSLPKLQLKYVIGTFRLYVKNFENKSYLRFEKSLSFTDMTLPKVLDKILKDG
jgi:hypothetical protein